MRADQRGGIVTGWLFRVIIGLLVVGVGLYEAGAVVVTHVAVDQLSSEAAREAGSVYGTTGKKSKAREAASDVAARAGATLVSLEFDKDEVVIATVEKEAPTFVAHRIPFLRRWTTAEASSKGAIT